MFSRVGPCLGRVCEWDRVCVIRGLIGTDLQRRDAAKANTEDKAEEDAAKATTENVTAEDGAKANPENAAAGDEAKEKTEIEAAEVKKQNALSDVSEVSDHGRGGRLSLTPCPEDGVKAKTEHAAAEDVANEHTENKAADDDPQNALSDDSEVSDHEFGGILKRIVWQAMTPTKRQRLEEKEVVANLQPPGKGGQGKTKKQMKRAMGCHPRLCGIIYHGCSLRKYT